jgi:phosphoribosylanthranilate isomerase
VHREGNRVSVTFREGPKVTDTFVYEGARSGRGETVDWDVAARIAGQGNMILAGGLDVHNVAAAIAAVRPFGVDVSSGVETAPGQKDSGLIRDFIRAAKAAGTKV